MRTKEKRPSGRSRPLVLALLGSIAVLAFGAYFLSNSTQSPTPTVNRPAVVSELPIPAPKPDPHTPALAAPVVPLVAEKEGTKPFPDPENDAAEQGADPQRIAQRNAEEQRLRDLRTPPMPPPPPTTAENRP